MRFFDVFQKNKTMFPDRIIFEDELFGEYTFEYAEEASAKVYSFLSDMKIGKEDIVVIRMKRSARIYLVMLGVWKAGAAFAVIGENSPEKYAAQVLKDTNPIMIFDDECYEKAMAYPEKEGCISADEHDLACVIYSTGSSGFFKGSMHEYGSIETVLKKLNAAGANPLFETGDAPNRNIINSGFYTIDAVMELIWSIYFGSYYYIIPFDAVADFPKYIETLRQKKIEIICVAPDTYKKLKQYKLPDMKRIDLSLDVSVDNLDNTDFGYTNSYGLTEAFGMVTSAFLEGKDYDVVPCGKPCPLTNVKVCDKEGNELPEGETGELYVENIYFRGYLNLPELTAQKHKNGWILTGDLAYMDSEDVVYVLGRIVDMVETEEGYIIPSMISSAVKRLFPKIRKSYIKLFKKENEIKICLYYCGDNEYSIDEFKAVLKGNIPDYMMPTHCIIKDEFEYFNFGKINRLSFEEPK